MAATMRLVAIVTGAGSGIGRAVALELDRRGCALVLAGRRLDALRETGQMLSGAWVGKRCDVADPSECERLVEEAAHEFGRLDVLVNNAGDAPRATIAGHTPDVIKRTFEVNALGPAYLIAATWRVFDRQRAKGWSGGCIVNISSMASLDPFPGFFAYAAAKSALNSMIRSCHKEGQQLGIRCFGVAPGAVETGMLRGLFDETAIPREATLTPEAIARVVGECVVGHRDAEAGTTIPVPSGLAATS
jgi:NAD(P)-dependent dehydrogenase (short-subunit alcohol dehydrogenase family)